MTDEREPARQPEAGTSVEEGSQDDYFYESPGGRRARTPALFIGAAVVLAILVIGGLIGLRLLGEGALNGLVAGVVPTTAAVATATPVEQVGQPGAVATPGGADDTAGPGGDATPATGTPGSGDDPGSGGPGTSDPGSSNADPDETPAPTPVSGTLPPAPSPGSDVPAPPNAELLTRTSAPAGPDGIESVTRYQSLESIEALLEFYGGELPALGWEELDVPGGQRLVYVRDDNGFQQRLTIEFSESGAWTIVVIRLVLHDEK